MIPKKNLPDSTFSLFEEIHRNDLNIHYIKKSIPKGEVIFHEGDLYEGIPVIAKGIVRVSMVGKNGREMNMYRIFPGETCILSLTSVLSNQTYPLTAIAEEEVEAYIFPCDQFKLLMLTSSKVQDFICNTIIRRFMEVIQLMDEIIFRSTDERMINFLLKHTNKSGDLIEITHDKIALEIGTAREVVSRLLIEMERKGWVKVARGKVFVLKREILEEKIMTVS